MVDMTKVLGLLLLLVTGVATADYQFESSFGSFGTAKGKFSDPRGVAIDKNGKIVISESGNTRIQLCTYSGSCSAFGSPGVLTGQFDKPRGVAVNSSNEIIVADRGNDRIQFCTGNGSCNEMGGSGTGLGQFESPRGVATLSSTQTVIADTEHNRIQICTQQASCSTFGSQGSSPGQFDGPAGVAINSAGRIVVTDRLNNRIQICTTSGSCTAFGSSGSGLGQFNGPTGVAVDSRDRIIVVDRFNHRVQVCTSQGSCTAFGSFGSANGQFNAPWGVAVDSQDRIIVADLKNNRIQIFSEPAIVPPDPVAISSFKASPSSISVGQSVTISWSVANATACMPSGGAGGWSAKNINPSGGSTSVTISTVGTFRFVLDCIGDGTPDFASVDVTVLAAAVVIDSFTASPTSVEAGQSVTLAWTVSNATACTPKGGAGGWILKTIDPSSGSTSVTINSVGTYTFSLQCSGDGASVTSDVVVTVTGVSLPFSINTGITDAWFFPTTAGQGFFIIVWEDIKTIFLAWFTYDVERPPADVTALLGEPGHRWITAQGPYDGDTAILDVFVSSGGIFNSGALPISTVKDGTITIQFTDCENGLVSYDIASLNLSGEVPIERIVLDNVPLCEALN